MNIYEARELANSEGQDLVEIVPQADPPVCEIMDFSKWRFDEKKREKELKTKQKVIKPKEIRLRPVSGDSDVEIKIKQLIAFLEDKRTVYVNMRFKNRELAHKDQGKIIMERVVKAVEEVGKADYPPRFEGATLHVRLVPK
jgi:translation initiation factor IF-3